MFNQIELFEIENPGVGVCQSNNKAYCFGCLRSRQERQLWLRMTNEERREVLRLIVGRRKRIEQMRNRQKQQMELDFEQDLEINNLFND